MDPPHGMVAAKRTMQDRQPLRTRESGPPSDCSIIAGYFYKYIPFLARSPLFQQPANNTQRFRNVSAFGPSNLPEFFFFGSGRRDFAGIAVFSMRSTRFDFACRVLWA